jgi:Protein of unknown function
MWLPFFDVIHRLSGYIERLIDASIPDSILRTLLADKKTAHEKVWFSKKDRHSLGQLPSANARHFAAAKAVRLMRGVWKLFFWIFAAAGLAFVAAVGWLAVFGFSNSYFSRTTETLIQSMAGPDLRTGLEDAKLSLDSTGNLAFQGRTLTIAGAGPSGLSGTADEVRIGLKTADLLVGKLNIGAFEADGVHLLLPASGNASIWDQFKTEQGQYSPAKMPAAAAALVEQVRAQLKARHADVISLKNVSFSRLNSFAVFPSISTLIITAQADGAFSVNGSVDYAGKTLGVEGNISAANQYSLTISGLSLGTSLPELAQQGIKFKSGASGKITVSGSRSSSRERVLIQNTIDEFAWTSKRDVRFGGTGSIRLELVEGVDKIEILPSAIDMGANRIGFTGAVGVSPAADTGAGYRFEIISNDSELQPEESPERRLELAFRLAGTVDANTKTLRFSDMAARTLGGDVIGQGTMRFAGGTPEMMFGIRIPSLKISDAKQLWPAMIAAGARKWVLDHVYGGTLTDSRIDVTFKSGFFDPLPEGVVRAPVTTDQVTGDFNVAGVRFDVIGDLPPVRDASGHVEVRGADTMITVSKGTAYLDDAATADMSNGTLAIPFVANGPVIGNLTMDVTGQAEAIANLADRDPINAMQKAPVLASDLSGNAVAHIKASFPLKKTDGAPRAVWRASVDFTGLSIAKEFNGQKLSDADGRLDIDPQQASFAAKGKLNGIPADISLTEPIGNSGVKRDFSAKLKLDDKARAALMPGLGDMLKGVASVEVSDGGNGAQLVTADLKGASLNLPWAGWSKGAGVPAQATFKLTKNGTSTAIDDFKLEGDTFRFAGSIDLEGGKFTKADFTSVRLNRGDDAAVSIQRAKGGYDVSVKAQSLDLRSLLKRVLTSFESTAKATGSDTVRLKAVIGSAAGFGSEKLQNLQVSYTGKGSTVIAFTASGTTGGGGAVSVVNRYTNGQKTVQIQTADGGALLRFLDYYDKMQGGQINVDLSSKGDGPLSGVIDARNFLIIGEPRLKSLVGTPVTPDGQSVAKAAKKEIDVSRVKFQRGYSVIQKGSGYLKLAKGILRSDQIGLSYEGTLYDQEGRIDMTGTFLPAFGLNRIFGDIPIIGDILGNGRDNGLIGITFKLSGPAKSPKLSVNPLSLVAPGIFRQIFEFQ